MIYLTRKQLIKEKESDVLEAKKKWETEAERARYHEERLEQLLKERSGEEVKYPSNWEPQTSNCELKELSPLSEEFIRIEKRVMETLKCKILKIER